MQNWKPSSMRPSQASFGLAGLATTGGAWVVVATDGLGASTTAGAGVDGAETGAGAEAFDCAPNRSCAFAFKPASAEAMREGSGAADAAAEAADATEDAGADAEEAAAVGVADAAALAPANGTSAAGPVLAGEAPRVPMKTAPATNATATAAPAITRLRLPLAG